MRIDSKVHNKSIAVNKSAKNRRFAFSKLHYGCPICNIEVANCKVCLGKIDPLDLPLNSSNGLFMRQSKTFKSPGRNELRTKSDQ